MTSNAGLGVHASKNSKRIPVKYFIALFLFIYSLLNMANQPPGPGAVISAGSPPFKEKSSPQVPDPISIHLPEKEPE